MRRRTPSPRRALARGLTRSALPIVAVFALLGLLGSCAGERPSLGDAKVGGTTTTTTTIATSNSAAVTTAPTGTTVPTPDALGPEDLLGYIATPVGEPIVKTTAADDGAPIAIAAATRAGAPTTFAVVGDPTADAGAWIEVLLPTEPNGVRAWVPRASVTVTRTPMRVLVSLGAKTLRVEDAGTEVFSTDTAIGTTENPTPTGATYVTELIDNVDPDGAYGPYAFGLALHSQTLSEFGSGDGQVGIHGTDQPSLIGQAVSHGCVRLTNDDVERLVDLQLPLGVPVFISA